MLEYSHVPDLPTYINPFDIVSGKVVQNHHGTFYFMCPGNNTDHNGMPHENVLHREGGPACVYKNGDLFWYSNGVQHRDDGPSFTTVFGHKEWRVNGYPHRLDGPAVEFKNGLKQWWIAGKEFSEKEFIIMSKSICRNRSV